MRGPMLSRLWFPLGTIIFGFWLFGVLPIDPPRWLTEGPSVDPIIAQPEIARTLYLVLLILISIGPFMWLDTGRLRRRFPLMDLPAVSRMVFSSRRGMLTFIVLLLFTAPTAWLVFFHGVPAESYFVRMNLAVVCGVLMITLLPPTAIVLANSSTESGRVFEAVARSFFPFRVVSLLDGSRLGPAIWANKHDNLRTILGQTWRSTVHRLVDISPIIIVDARSATPPVCEEIEYMLHPARVEKAVFVINDNGSAPGLQQVRSDWRRLHLVCSTPGQVPRVIASFLRNGRITQPGQEDVYDWRSERCPTCHGKMRVLEHRQHGIAMLFAVAQRLTLMDQGKMKSSFFCQRCERVYSFRVDELARNKDIQGLVRLLERGDLGGKDPAGVEAGYVASALLKIGNDSVPCLKDVLSSTRKNWQLRKNAAQVLGNLNANDAVPLLLSAIDDNNRNVQQGAMWALVQMGESKAIQPLKARLLDPTSSLWTRAIAANGLVTLTQTNPKTRSEVVQGLLDLARQVDNFHKKLDAGRIPPELIAERQHLQQKQHRYSRLGLTDESLDLETERNGLYGTLSQFNNGVIVEGLKRLKPESEMALRRMAQEEGTRASQTAKWMLEKLEDNKDKLRPDQPTIFHLTVNVKNKKPNRFKMAFRFAVVLSFALPGFGRLHVGGAEEVQVLEFSVVWPESSLTDAGYEVGYVEHSDGFREYRCSFRGHHFFSVLLDNEGAYAVRPRPGVDPDGWGTTVYLHPYLSGVVLENANLAPLEVREDGIVTSASGDLRDAERGKVGNWSVNLDVSYDPETKKIVGNGDLEIVLTEALAEDQDIVVTKIASNFLQDVPLLPGGEGNTGDTIGAYYEGSELPRQFWDPATQPGHFPQDPCEWNDIELPGRYNLVDTARQEDPNNPDRNISPIKAAWKPSVRLRFDLKQVDEGASFMFGAIFDTSRGDDFSTDNSGFCLAGRE